MTTKTVSISGPDADAHPSSHSLLRRRFVRMLPGLLCAGSLAGRLEAADQQDSPRDFLLMKLYEATLKTLDQQLEKMATGSPTPEPGSGSPTNSYVWTQPDYGCALWLDVARSTNNPSDVMVTLHNTLPGTNYQILSKTNLSDANWTTETNVIGASGQDWTAMPISSLGRTELFFIGSEARGYSLATNFAGLDSLDTDGAVADAMGAIGPGHFVELLNGKIAVFDRTNGTKLEEATMVDFFQPCSFLGTNCPAFPTMSDPRILFDHQAQRWVATAILINSWKVFLAVTTNERPALTNWIRFPLDVNLPGYNTDYDTLGLDANGLYVTALQRYSTSGKTFNGGHSIVAIKKPEIYQSNFVATYHRIDALTNDLKVWTVQPAVNFDAIATNDCAWLLAKGPPQLGSNYQGGALLYRRLQWSNTTSCLLDTNWQPVLQSDSVNYRNYFDIDGTNVVSLPPVGVGTLAPQAGGSTKINLTYTGSRLMNATARDGFLYTCHQSGLSGTNGVYAGNETGTNVDRSGVQWMKLRAEPSGGLSYYRHGRIYDPTPTNTLWYYFPSIAVNCAADMMLGFSGSSATNSIGAYYAWRPAAGPAAEAPVCFRPGLGHWENERWGDYSATTLDPLDGHTVWTVQQYATTNETVWRTGFGRIEVKR